MSTVTAVIVHHANLHDTFACVASLVTGDRVPENIIVVDNSEADFDISEFNIPFQRVGEKEFELSFAYNACAPPYSVKWLQTKNNGYAAALNVGIKKANADFYWLLNNDVTVAKDALKNLVNYAVQNTSKRLGVAGCKVMFHDRPNVINAVGGKFNRWKGGGYNIGANQVDERQFDKNDVDIDYAYGAAMFVSKRFVEEVGLLDESYFLYFEELDWTTRGNKKGFATGFCSSCVVYHKQGATTGKKIKQAHQTSDTAHWHYRNLIRFYRKHYPALLFVPYARLGGLVVKRLLQGRNAEAKLILKTMLGATRS